MVNGILKSHCHKDENSAACPIVVDTTSIQEPLDIKLIMINDNGNDPDYVNNNIVSAQNIYQRDVTFTIAIIPDFNSVLEYIDNNL